MEDFLLIGFHPGFYNWVATFEAKKLTHLASWDPKRRHWRWVHQDKFSSEEIRLIRTRLTISLKESDVFIERMKKIGKRAQHIAGPPDKAV
jgi:hypothetical protein